MYRSKYGSYPFTNKESIVINTAQAGTNEQVLVNASGAPTSGGLQLPWTNPDMGMTCVTQELAYNATAETVQTAINTLPSFTGSCVVTGGPIETGFTVTFSGGGYQNRPLKNEGFCLSVASNSLIGTTYTVGVSTTLNTAGVAGITSGNSYVLKMWAYTTSIGHQLTDGSIDSQKFRLNKVHCLNVMEVEQTHVRPHYRPHTLWWNEKEGGNLPCPPDYKSP
jgi:hypothetical protein